MSSKSIKFSFPAIANLSSTSSTSGFSPTTQGQLNVTSNIIQASGPMHGSGGLYTVAIHTVNYRGRVWIEGTLVNNPTDNDWFPIPHPNLSTPYIEFPQTIATTTGNVSVIGYSFRGAIAWIRARQDRDYLGLQNQTGVKIAPYGQVDKITLNMGLRAFH